MKLLDPALQNKIEDIKSLMRRHKVRRGYLFGSSVEGRLRTDSDIDVLVDIDENIDPVEMGEHLWVLQFDLEKLLGRKVDLLTSRSLRNPYLKKSIDESKQLIYG